MYVGTFTNCFPILFCTCPTQLSFLTLHSNVSIITANVWVFYISSNFTDCLPVQVISNAQGTGTKVMAAILLGDLLSVKLTYLTPSCHLMHITIEILVNWCDKAPIRFCTKMAEDSPRGLCCSVCYNAFKTDDENLVPRVLKCGHTYCSGMYSVQCSVESSTISFREKFYN